VFLFYLNDAIMITFAVSSCLIVVFTFINFNHLPTLYTFTWLLYIRSLHLIHFDMALIILGLFSVLIWCFFILIKKKMCNFYARCEFLTIVIVVWKVCHGLISNFGVFFFNLCPSTIVFVLSEILVYNFLQFYAWVILSV